MGNEIAGGNLSWKFNMALKELEEIEAIANQTDKKNRVKSGGVGCLNGRVVSTRKASQSAALREKIVKLAETFAVCKFSDDEADGGDFLSDIHERLGSVDGKRGGKKLLDRKVLKSVTFAMRQLVGERQHVDDFDVGEFSADDVAEARETVKVSAERLAEHKTWARFNKTTNTIASALVKMVNTGKDSNGNSVNDETLADITKRYGKNHDEIAKKVLETLKGQQELSQMVTSAVIPEMTQTVSNAIASSLNSSYQEQVKGEAAGVGNIAHGVAKEYLRGSDGVGFQKRLTINGQKARFGENERLDESSGLCAKQFGLRKKCKEYSGGDTNPYESPGGPSLQQLFDAFPDGGVNHRNVTMFVTSQFGAYGPSTFANLPCFTETDIGLGLTPGAFNNGVGDPENMSAGTLEGCAFSEVLSDIVVNEEKVVLTQSFPVGMTFKYFDGIPLGLGGVSVGLGQAEVKVEIPLAPNKGKPANAAPIGLKIDVNVTSMDEMDY